MEMWREMSAATIKLQIIALIWRRGGISSNERDAQHTHVYLQSPCPAVAWQSSFQLPAQPAARWEQLRSAAMVIT